LALLVGSLFDWLFGWTVTVDDSIGEADSKTTIVENNV